ncbi:MAG: 2-oxoisovalerate dehydrogenase E2 component (dihydrolipoyl transacylase) [Oceanospirillaceae bacterium]|jgi:2-oxoisovalerate dehydrogenase E2 component (dihydrolipoyl transacylase)
MDIFKLPDLGEGLPEAEIVEWFVKEGDEVKSDQLLVAMETAKAIVEIPSPQAGVVQKLYGANGDIINTGDPLLAFQQPENSQTATTITHSESTSVVGEIPANKQQLKEAAQSSAGHNHIGVKATPAVRALARRYDIDLAVITPSGPDGTIKVSDVERVNKIYSKVGKLEPLKGVRRTMAKTMALAHVEVVAVTIIDDADIQAWALANSSKGEKSDNNDITVRLIHAIIAACDAVPALNAWYDSHSIGRRLLEKVHLGLAIDTKEGLFVPVIEDAAQYNSTALRAQIASLKTLVNNRKIRADQLRGNSITLSNFGSIGGKYANPIIVPPTVAIIGAGRCFKKLVLHHQQVQEHTILPLSLTFDHRAATGAEAARFMQVLIDNLQRL